MSPYSYDSDLPFWAYIIAAIIMAMMVSSFNSKYDHKWEDGICTECNVQYELTRVRGEMNYYVCPGCKAEVPIIYRGIGR